MFAYGVRITGKGMYRNEDDELETVDSKEVDELVAVPAPAAPKRKRNEKEPRPKKPRKKKEPKEPRSKKRKEGKASAVEPEEQADTKQESQKEGSDKEEEEEEEEEEEAELVSTPPRPILDTGLLQRVRGFSLTEPTITTNDTQAAADFDMQALLDSIAPFLSPAPVAQAPMPQQSRRRAVPRAQRQPSQHTWTEALFGPDRTFNTEAFTHLAKLLL